MQEAWNSFSNDFEIYEFIQILQSAIEEINQIERMRFSYADIVRDALNPNAEEKIRTKKMPHYMSCYPFSSLLKEVLSRKGVKTHLLWFRTIQWFIHICVQILINDEEFIIWWHKDTVIFTDYETMKELYHNTNSHGDMLLESFKLDNTNIAALKNEFSEFLSNRADFIVQASQSSDNDYLMTEKLKLDIQLPTNWLSNFLKQNGLLPISSGAITSKDRWSNAWISVSWRHSIAETMELTLSWRNSKLYPRRNPGNMANQPIEWSNFFQF